MLKSKKIVDWLYNYSLYFIIGALLLVIIAIEPSFVRVSNFTTILTQSATKIIYACGIAGIIVLGGTDLALGREVGLAAVVAASLLQAVDYSQRVFSADQVPALPLIVPLLLVMVLLGIICAAHGFIVAHWGVAPFVASLGVQLISYGLCLQYFNTVCNSNPLSGFTKTYSKFCQGTIRIGNISLSYLMFYAIAVVAVIGADEVMECSGAADSPMKACKMARKTGKVALIATYHAGDVMIPANTVNFNELTIVGSKANPNVSEQVLHFFSTGAIQGDKLVTHTFPLEDYEKAVDIFEHKKDGSIKVVINP